MGKSELIICDGELISADEPVAPAISRGIMYGDGTFETFRTYSGQTFLFEKHFQRLTEGLDVLGIPFPAELTAENLKPLIFKLLQKKGLMNNDVIVRLQVWRNGQRGYFPDENARSHFSITASKCPGNFKNPVLATVETRRIPSESLPSNFKFSNGINYILAAKEAAQKGADDALMLTIDEKISETTISNIFWCKNDKIFTPSIECDLIPGITRKTVIDLIKDRGVEEGAFELNDILEADAVFMTNSVREILPVKAIDKHLFDLENDFVSSLKNQFVAFRDNALKSL